MLDPTNFTLITEYKRAHVISSEARIQIIMGLAGASENMIHRQTEGQSCSVICFLLAASVNTDTKPKFPVIYI